MVFLLYEYAQNLLQLVMYEFDYVVEFVDWNLQPISCVRDRQMSAANGTFVASWELQDGRHVQIMLLA